MGPVADASVSAYAIAPDGTVADTALATGSTRADGTFSLPGSLRYPVLIRATGGVYEEEATGQKAAMQGEIDAVYLSAPSQMVVSVYSNAVVAGARAAGGLTSSNVAAAISRVNAFAGDIDVQQTAPAFVTANTANAASGSTAVSNGAKMALALGAESQSRTSMGGSIADSTQAIVRQSANGDTLAECNTGAGNPSDDGTLAAPAGSTCAISTGAAGFVGNPRNRSGITSLAALAPIIPGKPANITLSSEACRDRIALYREQYSLFTSRRDDVQARLGGKLTAANWASFPDAGSWGPRAAQYGAIAAASCAADGATFQRELLMAVENYWIDQNLNYCHHHIPAWLPPATRPSYFNSTLGSSKLTCAPNRQRNGAQTSTPLADADIKWQGVDCSDFTSWAYNFAGVTHASGNLQTGIGTQACSIGADPLVSVTDQAGVLLDINQDNIAQLVDRLRPGDLLYITESAQPQSSPANVASGFVVSHVVTWTGMRFSDLRNGPEGQYYDLATAGQLGSRLGGDFAKFFTRADGSKTKVDLSQLGTADMDPWMIIDSHFAGPAYRPFILKTSKLGADWYVKSLSNVRRIIDADSARSDPDLAPLIITKEATSQGQFGTMVTLSSQQSRNSSAGHKLVYQVSGASGTPTCYRVAAKAFDASNVSTGLAK
ncbi:hypothetical protein GAS19_25505 [Burkholderia glumae]|uniref:hypothetical protein n=1 Tax=Burkholderia glumae TaxID=337 RepID=UPI001295C0E5|nr:hypothetical protein [Burkholderia glumae]QGA41505.1 hypothetical protein GAS19_25505 [Burkholderia glumae]